MSSDDHPGVLTPDMLHARVRLADVSDLRNWDGPWDGAVGAAHTFLGTFGQMQVPVVVDGEVVFGQEFVAAEVMGAQFNGQVAVVDLSDLGWPREKVLAAAAGLHRLEALAQVDTERLASLLVDIREADEAWLAGAGWDGEDLDRLLDDVEQQRGELRLADGADPDDVPDDAPAVTNPGDVWIIGPHRVICGDSTGHAVVAQLMAGGQADMVWTDPPYGVSYVGKTSDALTIENDDIDEAALTKLLDAAFAATISVCRPGAAWFTAAPAGPLFAVFATPLKELGVWRQTLVWEKDVFVMGRSDYHYRHEALFYGWVPGAAHHEPPDRTQDTVWVVPRPKRSEDHPTTKPVELVARAIRNHTSQRAVVLDPFGGSGTTLIAAHQEGRVARLVELGPRYVDVICKRAQQATGIVPVLESSGDAVDFIVEEG